MHLKETNEQHSLLFIVRKVKISQIEEKKSTDANVSCIMIALSDHYPNGNALSVYLLTYSHMNLCQNIVVFIFYTFLFSTLSQPVCGLHQHFYLVEF